MILLKGGKYFSEEGKFVEGDVLLDGGLIKALGQNLEEGLDGLKKEDIIDLKGQYIIPGLIDMHTHGAVGVDSNEADVEEFCKLREYNAKMGVTSFMPTTITTNDEHMDKILRTLKEASEANCKGAAIIGAHIEGPYINESKKGAHDENYIVLPKNSDFDKYRDILGDLHIHLTVAPEVEGGMDFIEYVTKRNGTIGMGHTDADYDEVVEAEKRGAIVFTHLYNAMKGLHHREPGVVGAALAGDSYVEIIADGHHTHPASIKAAVKAKGSERTVIITDSMHGAGFGNGTYEFGGFTITVKDGIARQEDGTLAGSVINILEGINNTMEFTGLPFEEVVKMATINPARVLGLDDKIGSIALGKQGDLTILDDGFDKALMVFVKGERVV